MVAASVAWAILIAAFVVGQNRAARRRHAPAEAESSIAPAHVDKDTPWVRYEVNENMSIQVTFIPQGKGVNVLILPVKKVKEAKHD